MLQRLQLSGRKSTSFGDSEWGWRVGGGGGGGGGVNQMNVINELKERKLII